MTTTAHSIHADVRGIPQPMLAALAVRCEYLGPDEIFNPGKIFAA